MTIRTKVSGGVWGSVVARLKSDFGLAPENELELAKLSLPQAKDLLARTEREMQAALAKAEAARRRASKLQLQMTHSPDTHKLAQLQVELQQAQSYAAHAHRLFEVHSRVQSRLISKTPNSVKLGDPSR